MDYRVTDAELSQVADSIRTKGGTNSPLTWPDGFSSAAGNISTSNLGTKTVTDNGTYNASSDSLDGYSSVTVQIPEADSRSY